MDIFVSIMKIENKIFLLFKISTFDAKQEIKKNI